jgi:hypothetical protein
VRRRAAINRLRRKSHKLPDRRFRVFCVSSWVRFHRSRTLSAEEMENLGRRRSPQRHEAVGWRALSWKQRENCVLNTETTTLFAVRPVMSRPATGLRSLTVTMVLKNTVNGNAMPSGSVLNRGMSAKTLKREQYVHWSTSSGKCWLYGLSELTG